MKLTNVKKIGSENENLQPKLRRQLSLFTLRKGHPWMQIPWKRESNLSGNNTENSGVNNA